ncbi:hypothetical protein [Bordetella petrii]|uniref:bestrophin-like domain n=1 Tax=Bordetella petrii TaxID=94624 RepID=UPI001E2F6CC4|nr:hypothetical protein [Bordetella petrii]MCD0503366.1 hypothetical protein [Bordetella petrii]
MDYSLVLTGGAAAFFLLLIGAIQIGRYIGHRHSGPACESSKAGISAIETSVFALLGLLIAFTFSGAANRMAERRSLIVQEVNAIGTAWLRIDLINPQYQPALRDGFRRYVDARIHYNERIADLAGRDEIAAQGNQIQQEIWSVAMQAQTHTPPPLGVSFAAAANDMFDASTSLIVAQKIHPPVVTYIFLGILALTCGVFVGLNLTGPDSRNLFHQVLYGLIMTLALYIIVDFEFPRIGNIRIDQSDSLLLAMRESMGASQGAGKSVP